MSASFGVMQEVIIMYPTYVTVRLTGREYIKRRGVECSLVLATGPDVSATSIDMWGPIVIDKAVRGMQEDRMFSRKERKRTKKEEKEEEEERKT